MAISRVFRLVDPLSQRLYGHQRCRWMKFRGFSSEVSSNEEKLSPPAQNFVETSLRGVGQVVFCNSSKAGLAILGGLAIGDPYLATLAAAGAGASTGAASAVGLDKGALNDGLWGYNGCLVGCATAVFMAPLPDSAFISPLSEAINSPLVLNAASAGFLTTVVGAGVTPFVAAALKPAMGTVPQWTLAFNFVTLSMLLRTKPFEGAPKPSTSLLDPAAELLLDPYFALHAPLKGVSQIFVVESSLGGAALLGGIALYSPGLAAHAFMGSSIGAASGLLMGADFPEVAMGLWGFNSALTSVGVGVFFTHSKQAVLLSACGAAATAAAFGALKVVFGGWDAPCLTLPFCITVSGCYLLKDAIPGLLLAENPHSPEVNVTKIP